MIGPAEWDFKARRVKNPSREEIMAIQPDALDALDAKSGPVRPCQHWIGVECVECVGLFGGFFIWEIG